MNLGSPSEWPAGRVAKRRCGAGGQVKPVVGGAVQFVQTTPPGLLAEYALGGLAAWFLVHPRPRPPLPPLPPVCSATRRVSYPLSPCPLVISTLIVCQPG